MSSVVLQLVCLGMVAASAVLFLAGKFRASSALSMAALAGIAAWGATSLAPHVALIPLSAFITTWAIVVIVWMARGRGPVPWGLLANLLLAGCLLANYQLCSYAAGCVLHVGAMLVWAIELSALVLLAELFRHLRIADFLHRHQAPVLVCLAILWVALVLFIFRTGLMYDGDCRTLAIGHICFRTTWVMAFLAVLTGWFLVRTGHRRLYFALALFVPFLLFEIGAKTYSLVAVASFALYAYWMGDRHLALLQSCVSVACLLVSTYISPDSCLSTNFMGTYLMDLLLNSNVFTGSGLHFDNDAMLRCETQAMYIKVLGLPGFCVAILATAALVIRGVGQAATPAEKLGASVLAPWAAVAVFSMFYSTTCPLPLESPVAQGFFACFALYLATGFPSKALLKSQGKVC